MASHYGNEFQGKKTASGERFSPGDMTAAHRKLP
jgi:rare lipoprotein A